MKSQKIRVLFLAGDLQLRGGTVWLLNLAKELQFMSHRVHIVCGGGDMFDHFVREHISITSYPTLIGRAHDFFLMQKLIGEIRSFRPDIIHIQSPAVLKVGHKVAKRCQIPFVLTVHTLPLDRLRISSRWFKGIIAISEHIREELVNKARIPKDFICVVLSGVRVVPRQVKPHQEKSQAFDEKTLPVVGAMGALEASKGHEYLLKAAKIVLSKGGRAKFLIVGSGPQEMHLRRTARELDLSKDVIFTPVVHDFRFVLDSMDIFVMPSLKESFGVLLLEAMALGKVVVASGVGGVYSVVRENQTGLLVPKGDPAALADALLRLLGSPEIATSMGIAGKKLVEERFTASRMAEETIDFYAARINSSNSTCGDFTSH